MAFTPYQPPSASGRFRQAPNVIDNRREDDEISAGVKSAVDVRGSLAAAEVNEANAAGQELKNEQTRYTLDTARETAKMQQQAVELSTDPNKAAELQLLNKQIYANQAALNTLAGNPEFAEKYQMLSQLNNEHLITATRADLYNSIEGLSEIEASAYSTPENIAAMDYIVGLRSPLGVPQLTPDQVQGHLDVLTDLQESDPLVFSKMMQQAEERTKSHIDFYKAMAQIGVSREQIAASIQNTVMNNEGRMRVAGIKAESDRKDRELRLRRTQLEERKYETDLQQRILENKQWWADHNFKQESKELQEWIAHQTVANRNQQNLFKAEELGIAQDNASVNILNALASSWSKLDDYNVTAEKRAEMGEYLGKMIPRLVEQLETSLGAPMGAVSTPALHKANLADPTQAGQVLGSVQADLFTKWSKVDPSGAAAVLEATPFHITYGVDLGKLQAQGSADPISDLLTAAERVPAQKARLEKILAEPYGAQILGYIADRYVQGIQPSEGG